MENVLLQYMEKRFKEPPHEGLCGPYPFVTISREFGCPSKKIGAMLVEKLNHRPGHEKFPEWKQISKEIIQEAATQLNLDPVRIKSLFQADQAGILDDILASFTTNYKSSQRIRKTIHDIIRSFALKGYVVLVGRAGAAINHSCVNSLHIRLQAPIEWRVKQISASRGINAEESLKLAFEMDKKRKLMIESFTGHTFDLYIFDLVFNCHTLSKEEIVQGILQMMEIRKMI